MCKMNNKLKLLLKCSILKADDKKDFFVFNQYKWYAFIITQSILL